MDLPGMDLKDIHVKLEEGDLAVTGERKLEYVVKKEGYYRKESSYGFFERHVSVPKGVKENDVKAIYDNGVLEISIPRPIAANGVPQARTIAVTTPVKPVKPIKA